MIELEKVQALHTIANAMGFDITINDKEEQPPKANPEYIEQTLIILNKRLGSKFRATKVNVQLINAIAKAKYTFEDISRVVNFKAAEWENDKEMARYLVPATLFRFNNFEKYFDASQTIKGNKMHELLKDEW